MENSEATEKFREADALFRAHDWAGALVILRQLDEAFPNERKVLYPMARSLAELHEYEEALALCDTLIEDHGYDRARRLRERLNYAGAGVSGSEDLDDADEVDEEESRFRIKPVRLGIALLLVVLAGFSLIPWWLAAGLIAGYFIIRIAIGRLFLKAFETPFKMKARALRGATATLHSVEPAQPPTHFDDEEEGVRAWYTIEVTIEPQPPQSGQAFTGWEPGELALADANTNIKSLADAEKAYQVSRLWYIRDGETIEDEGEKVAGPHRIRLFVGVPPNITRCQFVYYSEAFGEVALGSTNSGSWNALEQERTHTQVLQSPGSDF